jgi:hypothetical protein
MLEERKAYSYQTKTETTTGIILGNPAVDVDKVYLGINRTSNLDSFLEVAHSIQTTFASALVRRWASELFKVKVTR